MIGGLLPGPLQPSSKDSGLTLYTYAPFYYVASQPLAAPPVSILPSAITPIEIVLNFGPSGFTNNGPIGFGYPPLGFVEIPIISSAVLPPTYVFPPTVAIGNPPIEVVVLTPLPPGENIPPPPTGVPGSPSSPSSPNAPAPATPPETQAPPAFEPIPEPSTLLLVSAAAALLLLKRKR